MDKVKELVDKGICVSFSEARRLVAMVPKQNLEVMIERGHWQKVADAPREVSKMFIHPLLWEDIVGAAECQFGRKKQRVTTKLAWPVKESRATGTV